MCKVEVWGNWCSTHTYLYSLLVKQKQWISTILFSHFIAHTEHIYQNVNIPGLLKLVIYRVFLLMLKNSLNIFPGAISSLFSKNDDHHDHYTRGRRSCTCVKESLCFLVVFYLKNKIVFLLWFLIHYNV